MPASSLPRLVLDATLGGLVHDLGKPWSQAAGRKPEDSRFECETPSQHASVKACPSCRRYGSAHATLGASLLRDSLPATFAYLQQLALGHHAHGQEAAAGGPAQRYVILGDHLSAAERDDRYDDDDPPRTPAFRNPFAATPGCLVTPAPLDSSAALLRALEAPGDASKAMAEVVSAQRKALRAAGEYAGQDHFWLVDHLCGAIETSTSLSPSAFWHSVNDINLASHLQLAGAFAGALAAGGVRQDLDPSRDETEPIATLIAGDLSGIQAFIHRVASKGAARSLRARSFYLTVLSLVVARFIAERLGVTSANVLSSVGGNFLVLGPQGCEEALATLVEQVDAALLQAHGANLSVSLAAQPVTVAGAADFTTVMRDVRRRLGDAKARRAEFTAQRLGLFEPRGDGGPFRACRSCGDDATDGREDEDGRICRFCHSLEQLGRQLPDASYLTIEPATDDQGPEWTRVMRKLGYAVRLHERPPNAPVAGAIYALSPGGLSDLPCARSLPAGRYVPRRSDGAVADFRELAGKSAGRRLLAVLKADVDDLGRTFSEHFKRNGQPPSEDNRPAQSASRIATFMRFLSLFFEGRVNYLAENRFPGIYLVFAGGDDLAAVGPWDQMLEFVRQVRSEFAQWTAGNPAFHFSAGISFGDAARPVMAALDDAERLLGLAKSRPGKNAIALLDDRVLSWDDFEEMMGWYNELKELVAAAGSEGGVARSLLQRLKRLEALTEARGGKLVYGPELWRAYYALRRFAERYKRTSQQMKDIYDKAFTGYGGLKLAIAARLAEFATARGKEER